MLAAPLTLPLLLLLPALALLRVPPWVPNPVTTLSLPLRAALALLLLLAGAPVKAPTISISALQRLIASWLQCRSLLPFMVNVRP